MCHSVFGQHRVRNTSTAQEGVALSSGESELGALVKASAELLEMRSLLADFGVEVCLDMEAGSTAAIGMVGREGFGKVRHLHVADLWVQEKRISSGEIRNLQGVGDGELCRCHDEGGRS